MRRNKRHKVKCEPNERSGAVVWSERTADCDLAHYIHDRVELLQRAFAALRPRELKAMAPACVAGLSLDDLQELCLEELLGISSVRLCAVLDGAEPPSDTDSSDSSASAPAAGLETISLDSISSDERGLSPPPAPPPAYNQRRKRRCRRKEARAEAGVVSEAGDAESHSRAAERAGITVLELLELQARARAIRAQLAMEHTHTTKVAGHDAGRESDNDVQIKEEPPEVVELSSDEESRVHPTVSHSPTPVQATQVASSTLRASIDDARFLSKSKTDLVVIVPNVQTRKIRLKRNKASPAAAAVCDTHTSTHAAATSGANSVPLDLDINIVQQNCTETNSGTNKNENMSEKDIKIKKSKVRYPKQRKKKQENNRKLSVEREGSDHDEIMLQLSDTEKMDLLEDLDRKNYGNASSVDSEASTDGEPARQPDTKREDQIKFNSEENDEKSMTKTVEITEASNLDSSHNTMLVTVTSKPSNESPSDEKENITALAAQNDKENSALNNKSSDSDANVQQSKNPSGEIITLLEPIVCEPTLSPAVEGTKIRTNMSEGEISDHSSTREEMATSQSYITLSTSAFTIGEYDASQNIDKKLHEEILNYDDAKHSSGDSVYEVLEISDDSSCFEEEGVTILSKEPTTEEIEALSAKIDHEIQKEEVNTTEGDNRRLEEISWKHRYLDSKKVKKVMSTANILNALRKKNKELKRKIDDSKNTEIEEEKVKSDEIRETTVEEGTVDHYYTLEGSTKYVAPVPTPALVTDTDSQHLRNEMKKDAKQLLKMYKRLLKYNNMQKDPRRKTKKKKKNKIKAIGDKMN